MTTRNPMARHYVFPLLALAVGCTSAPPTATAPQPSPASAAPPVAAAPSDAPLPQPPPTASTASPAASSEPAPDGVWVEVSVYEQAGRKPWHTEALLRDNSNYPKAPPKQPGSNSERRRILCRRSTSWSEKGASRSRRS